MDDLICKFVYVDGEEIGESVDVYKRKLVIKVGGEFLAIPVEKIVKVEGDKIHVFRFDEKSAKRFGQEWVEEKSKPVSIEELKIFGFSESDASVVVMADEEASSKHSVSASECEASDKAPDKAPHEVSHKTPGDSGEPGEAPKHEASRTRSRFSVKVREIDLSEKKSEGELEEETEESEKVRADSSGNSKISEGGNKENSTIIDKL
jgi:hypothetical protein